MRLGKELKKAEQKYVIALSETETKNHRPYDRSLDEAVSPFIDRYIEHYRPILLGPSKGDRVWISWRGQGISGGSFSSKLRSLTKRAFGQPISTHFVRDCVMTSLANEDPEHVWLSMSLLHHADPRVAEKHYNLASDASAVKRYQTSIGQLRRRVIKFRTRAKTRTR